MEPDNVEKIIKNTFKEREISPSSEARERLIVALNTKPKKKRKLWLRYAVAASLLLGFFVVGSQFVLKTDSNEQPLQIGYDNETSVEPDEVNQNVTPKPKITKEVLVSETEEDSRNTVQSKKEEQQPILNSKVKPSNQQLAEASNGIKAKKESLSVEELNDKSATDELKTTDNKEQLANANTLNPMPYITAEELLNQTVTERSIEQQKNKKAQSKPYLESDALLVEMEKELFDEKNKSIFKRASKQLKGFKEAVANRNYKPNH
ncbi:hypothetical protein [Winogradskyella sp. SM1960]|uniref:hypothetical protein n=1 Tax=Winogradskyella sp. SM1960 TaxID=2865955 RepID=UPI001CD7A3A9|nr:hypothetical protein [Winogradskyella sp. SM1960]